MSSQPAEKTPAEGIQKEYASKLIRYMNDHGWDKKHGAFTQNEMYKAAIEALAKKGQLKQNPKDLMNSRVLEEITGDAKSEINYLDTDSKQCQMQVKILTAQLEYLSSLTKWEFISTSPSGLVAVASKTGPAARARKRLMDLTTELDNQVKALQAAIDATDKSNSDTIRVSVEDIRSELRKATLLEFKRAAVDEEVAHLDQEVASMIGTINAQAIYDYFVKNPDEARKLVAKVEAGGQGIAEFSGTFVPSGLKWAAGLAKFLTKAAARGAEEGLTMRQVANYREENPVVGDIFVKFTENPTLMAEALSKKLKQNVDLALSAIGIGSGEMGLAWTYVEATVKAVVDKWLEERLKKAKEELERLKLTPEEAKAKEKAVLEAKSKTLQEKVAAELKEIKSSAEQSLKASLIDKLKDGGTWGDALKALNEQEVDKKSLEGLGAMLVGPVVGIIMRYLPVTAAQIVTGEDLAEISAGALDSLAIPEEYRPALAALSMAAPPKHERYKLSDIIPNPYMLSTVDSHPAKAIKENGKTVAQYVAIRLADAKVWGYVRRGSFTPERIEIVNPPNWAERTLTKNGYREGGQDKETTGTWYEVSGFRGWLMLERNDAGHEWLMRIWRTKIGFADDVLGEMSLPSYELLPELPDVELPELDMSDEE